MINFKKISAIASSGLMIGMSIGVAAAANYPAPFVSGGAANVAIVYGTGSGVSILDAVEAGSIQSNLQSFMGGTTGTTAVSTSGETAALFGGSQKLYINSTLNSVKTSATKTDLPTLLADGSFSGNVDSTYTQTIQIGSNPRIMYKAQPLSTDDPRTGVSYSTSTTLPLINATVTFNKAVNFTHADSEGQNIKFFGMDFTISSSTDNTNLVLLKSAKKVDLQKDVSSASAVSSSSTATVTIAGNTYTVELVSGTSTDSTIKVTDASGTSETKTVNKASSKKINGITVAVISSTSAGNIVTSSVVAGSDKVTLANGGNVQLGDTNTAVTGTTVSFQGGSPNNLTTLTVGFAAPDSDHDGIVSGSSWTDPIFGTIKLDFPSVNYPQDSTGRENITITNSGDDRMQINFADFNGNPIAQPFAKRVWMGNATTPGALIADDDLHNITVFERGPIHTGGYVVTGNSKDRGYLLKLQSTSSTNSSAVTFTDVATGTTLPVVSITSSTGQGTLQTPDGNSYTVTLAGDNSNASAERTVRLSYPDGSKGAATTAVLYPSIPTSKSGDVIFYQPQVINLTNWDGAADVALNGAYLNGFVLGGNNLTTLNLPNGNGYGAVTIASNGTLGTFNGGFNISSGTSALCTLNTVTVGQSSSCVVQLGKFAYNFTNNGPAANTTIVYLMTPGGANINGPAIVFYEGKDYNSVYNGYAATLTNDSTYMSVNAITDTWTNGSTAWSSSVHSNTKLTKRSDYWGAISATDTSDTHHTIGWISNPPEQVYANLYVGSVASSVSGGTSSGGATQLGDVLVKDSEVSSVSTKNLVVVGGSCINSAAAALVGGAKCGSDWQSATGVGSGQYLIQSFAGSTSGMVSLLVAGYDVSDTANAGKYLRTQTVNTAVGNKYIGTTSTSATLQTTTTNSSA